MGASTVKMYTMKEALNPSDWGRFTEYYKNLNYYYKKMPNYSVSTVSLDGKATPAKITGDSAHTVSLGGKATPAKITGYSLQKVQKTSGYNPSETVLYRQHKSVDGAGSRISLSGHYSYTPTNKLKYAVLPEHVYKDFQNHLNFLKIRKPQTEEFAAAEATPETIKKKEKRKTSSSKASQGAKSLAIPTGGGVSSSVGR